MSDSAKVKADTPGLLSPRNVDTHRYKVVKPEELPELRGLNKLDEFSCWPWGIHFCWVMNLGPIVTNNSIRDWEARGLIKRLTPGHLPFGQEVTGAPGASKRE